jgi:hypothetical protein
VIYAVEMPQRADHAAPSLIQDVSINHGCRNVGMAEQFLLGTDSTLVYKLPIQFLNDWLIVQPPMKLVA